MFSDFDVILVLSDIHLIYEDRTWLEHFGPLLALYRDHLEPQDGLLKSGYVSHQYKNDLKIDFTLWPVEYWRKSQLIRSCPLNLMPVTGLISRYQRPRPSIKRRLKKPLCHNLWTELENTYTGTRLEENWEAMFKTIALMRKIAAQVGNCLGFAYPHDMDLRIAVYLQIVKNNYAVTRLRLSRYNI
jgi:hypothetical protein